MSLLEVKNVTVQFNTKKGLVRAVNKVSFHLEKGEILGIVGESGSGKSVTMLAILGLISKSNGKVTGGEIIYKGSNLKDLNEEEIRKLRGNKISMIFQDPMSSLNPVLKVGVQLKEVIDTHLNLNKRQTTEKIIDLLKRVGIPDPKARLNQYPHQFSGGMRQRVMIAMALSCNPEVLIADEPTTALDVTIQAQILELVKDLQKEYQMSVIWITHDLSLLAGFAEKVNVMYAGSIVEKTLVSEIYDKPKHPYSLGLIRSIPRLDGLRKRNLFSIEGDPPDLSKILNGCSFSPRCKLAKEKCYKENPTLQMIKNKNFFSSCFYHNDIIYE